jgi:hypothetical protein
MNVNYIHTYNGLKQLLKGYNPMIVIGYRHFHDWIHPIIIKT